jgi:murein DD-endopeptidase MepM/ murein hydrolase activator NlpD
VAISVFEGQREFDEGGLTKGRAPLFPTRPARRRASRAARSVVHAFLLALISTGASLAYFFPEHVPFTHHPGAATISGLSLPSIGPPREQAVVVTSEVLPKTVRREQVDQGLRALAGEAVPAATEDTGQAAAAPPPLFVLYTVVEGDTASAISARFGVELRYLLAANPDLRDGELLAVGQNLVVPTGNGILHRVHYGETLSDVAARFGVALEDILNWPGNVIAAPDQLAADALVFVPGGSPPISVLPEPTTVPTQAPVAVVVADPTQAPAPVSAAQPVASTGLIWPTTGPISSYMDASHPLGIDIDLYNAPGAAIAAATSGTVTFAGGDPCCSYGLYVVIVSPDGIETLYAHLSSIAVSPGQSVSQGAVIGYGGCTGYCTGNHLHFEVIDNGVRVNPLAYLP